MSRSHSAVLCLLSYNPREKAKGRQNRNDIFQLRVDVIIPAFAPEKLAETAGLEPAREILDGLADRYGYHFITFPNRKIGRQNLKRLILLS
jgi:hypothetical protein